MSEVIDFCSRILNLSSVQFTIDAIIKLCLTAFLSGVIGYEREHSHRPAGFRTHILVAVSSALVMLTSNYVFSEYQGLTNFDPTRLGAQVISGIGFLGAGTIMREGFTVKGLTTAASLWAVACIGLSVGAGYYIGAFVATLVIYLILNNLKHIVIKGTECKNIYVKIENFSTHPVDIGEIVKRYSGNLYHFEIVNADGKTNITSVKLVVSPKDEKKLSLTLVALKALDGVLDIYIE